MSVSNIIERKTDIEIAGLQAVIGEYLFRWQLATTAEAKLSIEGEAIEWMKELLDDSVEVPVVHKGEALFYEDYSGDYRRYAALNKMFRASFQALANTYIEYENTKKIKLLDLSAKLRRVQQKKSSLSLGTGEWKFSLVDSFFNQDWISSKFLSKKVCAVHPGQGIVTLPILKEETVRIKSVAIASGSNGQAGNSDVAVDVSITQTSNILDGQDATWFEYERMDTGPCNLVLTLDLDASQIINSLQLVAANLSGLSTFEIQDIVFSNSGTDSVSVKQLVNQDLTSSFWTLNAANADGYWDVVFVPVRAKTIAIKLQQRNSTKIVTLSGDGREVSRDRYGLGIKEVRVFRHKYSSVGEIGSTAREFSSGLYTSQTEAEIFPPTPDLYNLLYETSLDDGSAWTQQENIDQARTKTLLLDGKGGAVLWRAELSREDDSFLFLKSLFAEDKSRKETSSLLKTFSKFNSPATIPLKEKPGSAEVFLMQPKIGHRGDRLAAVPIHRSAGITSVVEAPIDFLNSSVDLESFHLYVNGSEFTLTEDNTAIAPAEWAFSNDYKQILFAEDLPISAQVRFVLSPELMAFQQRSDGYYHQTDFLFDPDKNNIKILFLSRDVKKLNKLLPRDKKVISLGAMFIEDDSVVVTSSDGTVLTAVASRNLITGPTTYYLDSINGVLYLDSESANDQHRISLKHHTPVALTKDAYQVVYEGLKPVGISIGPEYFEAKTITELANNVTEKAMNLVSGVYEARASLFDADIDALTLSQYPIVQGTLQVATDFLADSSLPEEIAFIDGHSEFLGLLEMNKESTNVTAADGSGLVSFTLAAGAAWFSEYSVIFDDTTTFGNLVGSAPTGASPTGDYFISTLGVVTVKAPSGITAGNYSYFYKDPSFNPDRKYSVDYRKGRVYSYADINSASSVTYKVATYTMSYDIADEIKDFTYDSNSNAVSVRTEGLKEMNSLIKVLWEQSDANSDIQELKDYFSPLLTKVSIRFA